VSVDHQQLALELRDRAAEIAGRVRAYFLEAVLSERRPLDPVLYRLLIPEFGEQERRNAAGRLFERLLHVGDTGACWRLHDEEAGRLEAVPMEIRDPIRHRVMLAVWRLRLALSAGPSNEAERQYKEMPGPSHEPRIDGDLYRVTALYEFDTGRTEQAITSIKRAIVAYQAAPDEVGIAAANVDYARYLLVRESTLEALEQLNRGRLSRSSDARERVELHRMLLDGIASFLYGNLSRARESITRVRDEIGPSGPREQYLFAVLLQGRLHFEMGSYAAAVESFAHACTEAQRLNHDAARAVFERWLARSEAYAGRVDPARRRLEQFPPGGTRKGGTWKGAEASGAQSGATERKLFLAEVEWFAGNAETALDVIEEFGGAREESGRTELPASFFTPERPDWSNGFASVEGHLAPGGRILGKLTRSFRAFLLSRVGRAEEGLSDLRELTRGEERSRSDPYSGLYCFLYSKLLQELPGTRPDNPVTMLGQSVKVMQERLSRIESPQDRSCVFEHNFWHQQLIRYARRHNMA
jgi:tetratricopeptide (TPR) repeat protein